MYTLPAQFYLNVLRTSIGMYIRAIHQAAPLIGWERFWRSELGKKEAHILILFSLLCILLLVWMCLLSINTPFVKCMKWGDLFTSVCPWQHSLLRGVRDLQSVLRMPPREKRQSASVCLLCRKIFFLSMEDWRVFFIFANPICSLRTESSNP